MPSINVLTFQGERPTVAPRLLPNEYATAAKDCDFTENNLRPYRGSLATSEPLSAFIKSIWRYQEKYWFKFESKTDVVQTPLDSDPWERVYFTSPNGLRVTNNTIFQGAEGRNMPAASYELGIDINAQYDDQKAPADPIVGVVNLPTPLPSEDDPEDDETRFYTYTFLTEQGEESAPAKESNQLEIKYPSSSVTLTIPAAPQLPGNVTKRRIYRTSTGGGIADFYLVAELPLSQLSYTDNVSDTQLGATLSSGNYEPPSPEIQHLTLMSNGILVGGFGNTVCFSEAYLPHAWPSEYKLTTDYEITAMAAVGSYLLVGTKGYPELFQGVSPDAMSRRKLDSVQACVSKQSMLNVDGIIMYASPQGLVAFSGNDVTVITQAVISTAQWKELKPETIEAYYYDGKYLGFYGASKDKAFIFDHLTGSFTFLNMGSNCGYTDLVTGELYVRSDSGVNISKWNAGDKLSFIWRSKEYYGLFPSFNTFFVRGVSLDQIGARIIADGVVIYDYKPGTLKGIPKRVPAKRGNTWQFEIYGSGEVEQVCLATSVAEVYG
ncbi:hypothetical protein [Vibrio fluvialis]|uniref:hypothetical protein n=1 Tax=Vibrio fluvialis TaxID=676 RepID=UPI001F338AA5|nr:hypothetical protein [Vibrio fluvialis]MCE7580928.1 hypothetical protein [Vibrio fluvialis]